MPDAIDFAATFARLAESGASEEATTLGGMRVRTVRVPAGAPGRWDAHAHTAETALVWRGDFAIEFRDRTLALIAGQCCVVPAGAEHRGTSQAGAEVVLFTVAEIVPSLDLEVASSN